jgi:hypothetical protein
MSQPSIECLGVYTVPCNQVVWREDIDGYYRSRGLLSETQAYRARLVAIVLVEVMISGADSSFDVGQFRQPMDMAPAGAAQVAYDEALLSSDGQSVIRRQQGCADGLTEGRICFFLHHYDPNRPIGWTYGEFNCPPPKPIIGRLAGMMPYQPI